MAILLKVDAIVSYLAQTGWEQDPRGWRGASLWQHPGDYEVLVPGQDGLGDADRRVREILRCLSAVEDRAMEDIAEDISRPELDRQFFRTFPAGHDSGYTSLPAGVQAMQGIRKILDAAARTVVLGQHFAFRGRRPPRAVVDVLQAAEIGPSRAGSYIVEVRLNADLKVRAPGGEDISGRAVLVQVFEAVSAAQTAVLIREPEAFDQTVTAGVSAELCTALSDLSGTDRAEPFEITFRWGRSQPVTAVTDVVPFPENSGRLLQLAAARFRGLNASGPAAVTGMIEDLHDDAAGDDRWRIKVRGELSTAQIDRSRRAVWVRLGDQNTYDRAMTAHRERREITVAGELSSTTGRVELVPESAFEI
jgi:hypothetical protein